MTSLIFQVIGSFNYYIVNFTINSKVYNKKPLSSIALSEHIKNSKIIYLAPESLATYFARDIREAKDIITNELKLKERIKEKLKKFFESSMNESIDFEVEVIPSIGVYSSDKGYSLLFEGGIDNVIASIMLNSLERLAHCEEVIIDVSVGQNIYNVATLEAMRTLQVYYNLKEITRDESKAPSFKIATCPPIPSVKETESNIPILLFPYNVKTFFEFPYKKNDFYPSNLIEKYSDIKREISQKFGSYNEQFNTLLEVTKRAFNSIKYNVPLAFLQIIEFSEDENIILKNLMEIYNYIENKKEIYSNDNKIFIKRLNINRLDLGNYLLTIALYSSLKEFKNNIIKEKEKTSFEIISEYFTKLYNKLSLGLNTRLLVRDLKEIDDLVERAKEIGISLEKDNRLEDLFQRVASQRSEETKKESKERKKSDIKRNFFAHSGLERTITYVRINEKGKIELSYGTAHKNKILKWIRNPEN
jgi:CRISPR-associated protein Csx1